MSHKATLKPLLHCSRYTTIDRQFGELLLNQRVCIFSHSYYDPPQYTLHASCSKHDNWKNIRNKNKVDLHPILFTFTLFSTFAFMLYISMYIICTIYVHIHSGYYLTHMPYVTLLDIHVRIHVDFLYYSIVR